MKTDFRLILALWGAGLGAAGQYAKISVVFHRLDEMYPEAGAALGFVVSLVGFVGIVFGVVAGLVVARLQYRRALIWALWAGAAISAVQALSLPLPLMLATRAVEGLSHLAIVVATPTLIAQLSEDRHKGLTLTLWGTFFGVAFTLLVVLGLPLVEAWGIPALFVAHALWMAVFAVILGARLRGLDATSPEGSLQWRQILGDHVTIYRSPSMAAPGLGWLFYTFCFLALLTVLPPFIEPEMRARVMGSMPLAAILVSMTLGVWLLRFVPAVAVVQLGFAGSIVALLWLLIAPGLPVACIALAGALGLIQGASFAAVAQINATAETRFRANGAMAQMGNLGNTLGTPLMLGILGLAGYSGLILISVGVMSLGILAHGWLALRRRRLLQQTS